MPAHRDMINWVHYGPRHGSDRDHGGIQNGKTYLYDL